jgi:hypothetical protein
MTAQPAGQPAGRPPDRRPELRARMTPRGMPQARPIVRPGPRRERVGQLSFGSQSWLAAALAWAPVIWVPALPVLLPFLPGSVMASPVASLIHS